MPFNGSGVFSRVYSWATDRSNGIPITASRVDTEDNGFATGLTNCICKDGQTTTTAIIPFAQGISTSALGATSVISNTELVWIRYGTGATPTPVTYGSGTSFLFTGVDATTAAHAGRRVKAVGSGTGTIYGTISSSSFSTNTTVNVTWDSGSLSNETLTIYLSQVPKTGECLPGTITAKTFSGCILSGDTSLPGSGKLSSSGALGIGVAPLAPLDVKAAGTGSTDGFRVISQLVSNTAAFIIDNNSGGSTYNGFIGLLTDAASSGVRFQASGDSYINGGNLFLGYTSSNGSYKLQVNSQIFATSATIATSDQKYKENITDLTGTLALINALQPRTFTWKHGADAGEVLDTNGKIIREAHNFAYGPQVGFIAQEVETALAESPFLPAIIKTNMREDIKDESGSVIAPADEFKGIAEGNLIPLLVGAIKELTARIALLEAK